ncbi:MAG: class I SAM-dependent methyltransferase [Acidimicrobiia bacterium]
MHVDRLLWEQHSQWWVDEFTDGVDPEYEEQIIPLAVNMLGECRVVLDAGTGEGQCARALARAGVQVIGMDPAFAQLRVAAERDHAAALMQGAIESLPVASGSVDGVLACLVFEHVPNHVPAIAEISRVLQPGGRFLLVLNHPLMQTPESGWVIDHVLDEQYWRVGPYLDVAVAEEELAPGVVLPFVHRPLSQYVNALADHGLVIERMFEFEPPAAFLAKAPEYAETGKIPRILGLVTQRRYDAESLAT